MAFRYSGRTVANSVATVAGRRANSVRRCKFTISSSSNNNIDSSLARPLVQRGLASRSPSLVRGGEWRRGLISTVRIETPYTQQHQQRRLGQQQQSVVLSRAAGVTAAASGRRHLSAASDKGWEESPGYFIRGGGEGGEDGDPGPPPPLDKSIIDGPTEKVQEVMEIIDSLDFIELHMLTELMAKKMGLEEIPTLNLPGQGRGGGDGGDNDPVVEEKSLFNLTLTGFGEKAKIKVIKEIRGITGLGLREAKELAEELPKVVKSDVNKEEGAKLVEQLEKAGATVELA